MRPRSATLPPEAMTKPRRPTSTSVHLSDQNVRMLEERGGRPDRGNRRYNQAAVLARHLDLFAGSLERSDPRVSAGFPQAFFELTLALLTDPWQISADQIDFLDVTLTRRREFGELAARHGVDPTAYEEAIRSLSYSHRIYLVDAAEKKYAHDARIEPLGRD
jgi:hypothetical protein